MWMERGHLSQKRRIGTLEQTEMESPSTIRPLLASIKDGGLKDKKTQPTATSNQPNSLYFIGSTTMEFYSKEKQSALLVYSIGLN